MIRFPSKEESRFRVLAVGVLELPTYRELSSCVCLPEDGGAFIERRRDRMHGIDAVMITKLVSMYNHRS